MIVKADFLKAVDDFIERVMTYGLSREQANQLCQSRLRLVHGGKEGERA